jgi:hypothetical protein
MQVTPREVVAPCLAKGATLECVTIGAWLSRRPYNSLLVTMTDHKGSMHSGVAKPHCQVLSPEEQRRHFRHLHRKQV